MAGPSYLANGDDPNDQSFSAYPSLLPRQMSTSRSRGPSVSSAAPHSASKQTSLQRIPSNQEHDSDSFIGADAGRRPSLSPGAHFRQPSQASAAKATLIRTPADAFTPPKDLRNGHIGSSNHGSPMDGHYPNEVPVSGTPTQAAYTSRGTSLRQTSNHKPAHALDRMFSTGPGAKPVNSHLQSVGEFAQQHLFSQFYEQANSKIAQYTTRSPDQPELDIYNSFGPGADSMFDQLLQAIGHSARQNPTSFIDKVTFWHDEVIGPSDVHHQGTDRYDVNQERKFSLAIYLLCRALLEILAQSPSDPFKRMDLDRVESLVYNRRFRSLCKEKSQRTQASQAKWDLLTQVIGGLFDLDFSKMSDRVIQDLQEFQQVLGTKGARNVAAEEELTTFLRGLRTIRLKLAGTLDAQPQFIFLHKITEFFAGIHGEEPKKAYCRFIGEILLPVAASPERELLLKLTWRKQAKALNDRLAQLEGKPKYWQDAFPVQAILACASPRPSFEATFKAALSNLSARLREQKYRANAIKAICRLVWTYLNRNDDDEDMTMIKERTAKTIGEVIQIVFFQGKRYTLSKEPAVAKPLVQLIRIIGYTHQDLCFTSIIYPLLNHSFLIPKDSKDVRVEHLDPDKSVIGIRACLALLDDIQRGEQPAFPTHFEDENYQDTRSFAQDGKTKSRRPSQHHITRVRHETLSHPMSVERFSKQAYGYFQAFCNLVFKIVLVCDAGFGGQASMDDRYALTSVPKTPLTGSFSRKDDTSSTFEERMTWFELLNVGICALPRCVNHLHNDQKNQIFTSLCNATAHHDSPIALSSALALNTIARQGYAQMVVQRFLDFVLNYDNRCSIGGGGLVMTRFQIEHTLALYLTLLDIWIEDSRSKAVFATNAVQLTQIKSSSNSEPPFSVPNTMKLVDRVESQALFFLCSPLPETRCQARSLLAKVPLLDAALGQEHVRIFGLLEKEPTLSEILTSGNEHFTIYQKSILARGPNALTSLICEPIADYKVLWYTVLPHLVGVAHRDCAMAVAETRHHVCMRLSQMQASMEMLDETARSHQQPGSIDFNLVRTGRQANTVPPEGLIDQWKAYLIFACKTIEQTGKQIQVTHQEAMHTRKSSKSSSSTQDSISTSTDLFCKVIPFLASPNISLRQATIVGLGSIGPGLLRSLLESVDYMCDRGGHNRSRSGTGTHNRTASSPRRSHHDVLSVEIANVFDLVARLLRHEVLLDQTMTSERHWILDHFAIYTKELNYFLHHKDSLETSIHLRIHYCNIVENLWLAVRDDRANRERWLAFHTRRSAFTNMETWTGLKGFEGAANTEYHSPMHHHNSAMDRRHASQSLALKDKKTLSKTAMNAMATLCDGPASLRSEPGTKSQSFDLKRLMQWIHSMFEKDSDSVNAIGRRALRNIIEQNPDEPVPAQKLIGKLYKARSTRCLNNYLTVLSTVSQHILGGHDPPRPKILTALLYTLAHSDGSIRTTSARLLRVLDEKRDDPKAPSCKLQAFEMSISDRTPAVYRKAHFDISEKLASAIVVPPDAVFSEFARHFRKLPNPEEQRSFVHAILPWITKLELQLQESKEVTHTTYMVLMNLLEITFTYSAPLQHEVQAMWKALVVGNRGNVRLILDFTMALTVEKKNPRLVEVARQIIVFISETPKPGEPLQLASQPMIDALLQQIIPQKMEFDDEPWRPSAQRVDALQKYPHTADIPMQQLDQHHSWDMTLGQLSLILLVDLIVSPKKVPLKSIPSVLQAVLVLWDHRIPIVQEQAREMLVHLIHELVIAKFDENDAGNTMPPGIQHFVDLVRARDTKVLWAYSEHERAAQDAEISKPFRFVVSELIQTFAHIYPDVNREWGVVALHWALRCRVLHLAIRSLQVFRCILLPLDSTTVSELVRVLHHIVADDESEKQIFAIEAMRTLRAVLTNIEPSSTKILTQLFWAVSTLLGSGKEAEFEEGIVLLNILLDKLDLNDPEVCAKLMEKKPDTLEWPADGLTEIVLPGCRSNRQFSATLKTLDRLIRLPSNDLVGGNERFLYVLLANLPRFLRLHDNADLQEGHALAASGTLAMTASTMGYADLANDLNHLSSRTSSIASFAPRMFDHIRAAFYPSHEYQSLVFLLGLLNNDRDGIQEDTLKILDTLTDHVNMKNVKIANAGPDLVSPLLRLLQTGLTELALRVLDKFSAIMSHTTSDKRHLNMSMANPRANREERKQYDDTESMFGIPEESGWSVAVPGKLKASARKNLDAIANMYLSENANAAADLPTPEVEFQREGFSDGSYFPRRPPKIISDGSNLAETSMGELVTKMENLDDFFAEDDEDADTLSDGMSLARSPSETTPTNYMATPLTPNGSFGSTTSSNQAQYPPYHNRSFQSSVSTRGPPMSPSAFTPAVLPRTGRPGMPDRSYTSPARPQVLASEKNSALVSVEESESLSDDDALISGATSDASSFHDGRAMQRSRSGLRDRFGSFRRFTSRSRNVTPQYQESPEVPRVPDQYKGPTA